MICSITGIQQRMTKGKAQTIYILSKRKKGRRNFFGPLIWFEKDVDFLSGMQKAATENHAAAA